MKLWLDDVRPAPPGWTWARTLPEAKSALAMGVVEECSLDHDLGYDGPTPERCEVCKGSGLVYMIGTLMPRYVHEHEPLVEGVERRGPHTCHGCDGDGWTGGDLFYVAGQGEDTGMHLVKWMVEEKLVPRRVVIHSWNHPAAASMASYLAQASWLDVIPPVEVCIAPFRVPEAVRNRRGSRI